VGIIGLTFFLIGLFINESLDREYKKDLNRNILKIPSQKHFISSPDIGGNGGGDYYENP
jgi:hypothetical protein